MRFVIQPLVSVLLGIRAGIADAKARKPAYLYTVFTDRESRRELVHSGWKDVVKVFVLAVILDVVFQLVELRSLYVGEALLIATALAIVPYTLVRGPVNRLASARLRRKSVKPETVDERDRNDRAA